MTESSDLRMTRIALRDEAGRMPALGFGTLIPDAALTITATRDALEVGFRHFDCAERYGNEREVGKPAIAAGNIVGGQQSFRATLEIGPRDQEALARGCEALASGVEASGSYERSAENALALSYVNDPVAVPYLARSLMANKLVEPIAIEALERIGTPEAVRALGPALNMSTNHSSILAKSALARIQTRTADPEVRGEVARVMSQATSNQ